MSLNTPGVILFVINDAPFFLSHRLPLAQAARDAGYDVHVAAPDCLEVKRILAEGLSYHSIPVSRWGTHVLQDANTIWSLFRLYKKLKPQIIHHVTIKPVLYGSLAARWAKVPSVVNAVPGLGHVFVAQGIKARILRELVKGAYRLFLRHRRLKVIFQNPDDMHLFVDSGIVAGGNALLIKGAGVDTDYYHSTPLPETTPVVIMASRLLWNKGVGEFVAAANRLKAQGVVARFALVGEPEAGNPAAVPIEQLKAWVDEGRVEWWGRRIDMPVVFAQSNVVCLPSYYPEGVPKVLIEAASCGRAIVTTDTPGCREIVGNHENGLLVPPRDVEALAAALQCLIEDRAVCERMGRKGREIVIGAFSLEQVIGDTLQLYRTLLNDNANA